MTVFLVVFFSIAHSLKDIFNSWLLLSYFFLHNFKLCIVYLSWKFLIHISDGFWVYSCTKWVVKYYEIADKSLPEVTTKRNLSKLNVLSIDYVKHLWKIGLNRLNSFWEIACTKFEGKFIRNGTKKLGPSLETDNLI